MRTQTYSLCGVTVEVEGADPGQAARIQALWGTCFSLRKGCLSARAPAVHLHFKSAEHSMDRSPKRRMFFQSPNLSVFKTAAGFCLQCGASALDLDLPRSRGDGVLDESFWSLEPNDQREFFLLGFLMLFRRHGLYGLHANGVVKQDAGYLIAGSSGNGKTTLTLALVHEGWRYLSDDALVLRTTSSGIEAQAFRRGFSCTHETATRFPKLRALDDTRTVKMRDDKRLVDIDSLFPDRFTARCQPQLLLFPQIDRDRRSRLFPLGATEAMMALIQQSPGILIDRRDVRAQMDVLKRLLDQAQSYRLFLGLDVYQEPAAVSDLLWSARRGR